MKTDYYLWWNNQKQCEENFASKNKLPDYLQEQLKSMHGRPLRGRLWVDSTFPQNLGVDNWPDSPLGNKLANYGGIAFKREDLNYVQSLPGAITDFELNLIKNDNKFVVDFHGSYRNSKLFSRMVWQKLFDIYREKGGQLTNLDNFLCDLDYFEDLFEKGWPTPMYWTANLEQNYTELLEYNHGDYLTPNYLHVVLTYTGKTMELEVLDESFNTSEAA